MTEVEKNIQNLLIAVTGMEKIQETTIQNIADLSSNVSKLSDVHTKINNTDNRVETLEELNDKGIKPQTLKYMLSFALVTIIGYGTWITLFSFNLDKEHSKLETKVEYEVKDIKKDIKSLSEKISDNRNQITYIKGAKLDKPKG